MSSRTVSQRRFLFKLLLPFKRLLIIRSIVSMHWAFDLSFRSYVMKLLIDASTQAYETKNFKLLVTPVLLYIGASCLSVIFFRVYEWIRLKLNPRLRGHISMQLMKHLMKNVYSSFQENFIGSIQDKIKNVILAVPAFLDTAIDQIFSNIITIITALFTLSTVGIQFSLALGAWIATFIIGSYLFSITAKKLSIKATLEQASMMGHAVDILNNILSVQLFSRYQLEQHRFSKILHKYVVAYQERDWFFIKMFSFQDGSFILYQALCLFLLFRGFNHGTVTSGDFVFVLGINTAIFDYLWNFARDIDKFVESIGNIDSGLDIVLKCSEVKNKSNAKKLIVTKGEIVFDRVHFNYENKDALFKDKTITIEAGQKIGLIGHSGSGKTTFVNLILRLFDINEGHILIDGQNIQDITQKSLRSAISIIPQNPILFNRTIMENIRYGKPDATDTAVIQAAQKAQAHEFIQMLPQKYKTIAGDKGSLLSGGQVQRIIIARAILKNAPILILDEATSQLDFVTEQLIQKGLNELMKNKTCLIVAHRISTIMLVDKILVFENGSIVESGTHRELLEKNSMYKEFWNSQNNNHCVL